ncbi:tRNA pseudouridine(38-40) synthase TruA [Adhaeribacter radiodurans]|uniref:tRNA pseudouridine synthase A n=1 Tax=Adhaeribacter radiodurans TaxID=2745197 RepID=A0A7L7L3L3_9BACT|nr:tRNA pseudouridine(38-40) synthase TruA [Adhaeribacter radiodurans]QMU27360.1 tRNA pseudouridine(38-40) synthase TruA [Adhaeribacter radiodurans]
MRYFLEIAYDGTNYHGWQIQPNAISVQQVLNDCLSTVLRETIETIGSGRTDTGVHAEQQFVHFDVARTLNKTEACYRFNRILPPDIAVKNIYEVLPEAHARFDAIARTYEYRICLQNNPFLRAFSYFLGRHPNVEQLNEAASALLNFEDFTTFSKVKGDTKHYQCQLYQANWQLRDPDMLIFTIRANRFLRGMVRLIVGTLLDVGSGKLSVAAFKEVVASQDRRMASAAAPATGLFLIKVEYPENFLMIK